MPYIATIQVIVKGRNEADACDTITAMLSENLQQVFDPDLLDWQYLRLGEQWCHPTHRHQPSF